MAISIHWPTKVIMVPQADLTPLGGSRYELDVNEFRLALKELEDSEDGQVWPTTHNHNTELTLSGVTYARSLEIINGYTVEFEDGVYVVVCIGANHNLGDVKTVNSVSMIIGNSAGMVVSSGGGGGSAPSAGEIGVAVRSALRPDLNVINDGVKKASKSIPHNTNLP